MVALALDNSNNSLKCISWMKTRWVFLNLMSHIPSHLISLLGPKTDFQTSTIVLNRVDISRLLPHCGVQGLAHVGSSIHASIIKNSEFHYSDNLDITHKVLAVWNSLLCMYSRQNGSLSNAVKLFDEMPVRDTVSWNTMISGFLRKGQLDIGFGYFKRMREMGFHRLDHATLTTVLSGFVVPELLGPIKMVHCLVFQSGYDQETPVGNSLITSYFRCGCSSSGRLVFDEMFETNVITWTALISGLAQSEFYGESLKFFVLMRRETVLPNTATYLSALMACSGLQAAIAGRQIHALLWKLGSESGVRMESALMDMYSKCGIMEDTWQVFESAKELDEVALTIILAGFAQNGFNEEAIQIFKKIVKLGIETDANVVSVALRVFGNNNSLGLGRQLHALIFKKNFIHSPYANNGLINMYSKCGALEDSIKVFDEMPQKNSISWNSMIAAFARHGEGSRALELYEEMKLEGVEPTDVTFLSLLHACSHVGLVTKGMEFLNSMVEDHGMSPRAEHYACVVDMLGRAGLLTEAKDFIEGLDSNPYPIVWQAMLGACSFHFDSELGKVAAKQLRLVEPESPASYILMAKIYSSEGKWKERAGMMKRMKESGVSKESGTSWIEIGNKVDSFVVSDKTHPQVEVIYGVLEQLFKVMADEEEYVPS